MEPEKEVNGGYVNGEVARPVPPARQRERFETLQLEETYAKLADFGNGIKVTAVRRVIEAST